MRIFYFFGDSGSSVCKSFSTYTMQNAWGKKSVKFLSKLVLVCMSVTGVGKFCLLKCSVNTVVYQDVFDHFLISYIENLFGDNKFILYHDFTKSRRVQLLNSDKRSWLTCQYSRDKSNRKFMGNNKKILKNATHKILKKWSIGVIRGLLKANRFVITANKRNPKCKMAFNKLWMH